MDSDADSDSTMNMDIDSEPRITDTRMVMLKAYYLIKFGVDINSPMLALNGEQIFAQLIDNCQLLPQQIADDMCPPVDDPNYDPEEMRQIVSDIQQIIDMNINLQDQN